MIRALSLIVLAQVLRYDFRHHSELDLRPPTAVIHARLILSLVSVLPYNFQPPSAPDLAWKSTAIRQTEALQVDGRLHCFPGSAHILNK